MAIESTNTMQSKIAVVLVPLPCHSHLNQLLHFGLLLSGHAADKISIHYISLASQIKQVQSRLHVLNHNSIQFHELPLSPHSNPTASQAVNSKFPGHIMPMIHNFELARASLADILSSISEQYSRLVVIHDPLSSFAAVDAESLPNAEAFTYMCLPAVFQLAFSREDAGIAQEFFTSRGIKVRIPSFDGILTDEFNEFCNRYWGLSSSIRAGLIMNTCRAIEGEFIDLVAQEQHLVNDKIFAIAPLTSMRFKHDESKTYNAELNRHACLDWLDKQPSESVLYVSFGTTITLGKQEIENLASALQHSGQRFIWVLRNADNYDIFALDQPENTLYPLLPLNWEQTVKDRGLVITGWAPQLAILAHRATGAFMSHCGWNSCTESLSNGVPIIAWPMHSDQPVNAMLVAEYHKAGVILGEWARREECISTSEIEEAIKRVMINEEGKEIRKRAKSLGIAIQEEANEGGSSTADFDAFVAYITRDCMVAAAKLNGSKEE